MSVSELPGVGTLKSMLGGRGADPNAAARRVFAREDDEEAMRGPDRPIDRLAGDEVERSMRGVVAAEITQLAERRALALLVTEFVRRKHAKRLLPSAGDAAIAFQIADLLGSVAGSAPSALDAAFGDADQILPEGPPINPAVDRAMRRRRANEEAQEGASGASGHEGGDEGGEPAP